MSKWKPYWATLLFAGAGAALGGWLFAGGGAVVGAAAGVLAGWATARGAHAEALAGAVKGIIFVAIIGPGADWLISGNPVTDKLALALVSGGLVGAALGIKNARPNRKPRNSDSTPAPA